jgi:hypothetical protein
MGNRHARGWLSSWQGGTVFGDGCEKGINGGHERGIVYRSSVRSDAKESVTVCIVYREEAPILGAGFC